MAGASPLFSAVCDGSKPFFCVVQRRGLRPDDGQASRPPTRLGGTLRDPDRCGDRYRSGEDDGKRPLGLRRGQEGQGRKRHIVVEEFPIEIAVHEASAQGRDGDPAVILEVLEKAPHIEKIWADGGYQDEKLASALKKLGLDSDLEIIKKPKNVALPASGEGLRAELGELFGVGATGRVPLHDAPNRKGCNMLIKNNNIRFFNYDSYSEAAVQRERLPARVDALEPLRE